MASVLLGVTDRFFSYSFTVGGPARVFRQTMDIALAPEGVIYAVNRGYEHPVGINTNTKVSVIRVGDDGEEEITAFGSYGTDPGEFLWPTSIALDKDINVYVCDEFLHRITIWNKDGVYISHWGTYGSGNGELNGPSGLAIRDDILFLVDSQNHRVQKFTLDGKYVGQFGRFGDGQGQLNNPWGISLDKDGNVFVADWRNDRIQSFTADGEWLASFGRPGTGGDTSIVRVNGGIRKTIRPVGEFNRPAGVCVDNDGDIYVADWLNNRVQVLTPDGKFITEITGNAGLSRMGMAVIAVAPDMIQQRNLASQTDSDQEKLLWGPMAVKFDEDRRRLFIVDTARKRLQIYQKNTGSVILNAETLTPQSAYKGLVA